MSRRVILDGTVITESPKGLEDLRASIKTDKALRGRFLTEDATLVFHRDGYRHIKRLDDKGFCGEIKIKIQEDADDSQWIDIHDGIIHLPACEFGIEPFYVSAPVDDNSFFARINKNKSLKALFTTDRSKNDKPIIPAQHDEIECFRPSTGAYSYPSRWIYSAFECFRFIIEWMSDGEVGFVSDTLDAGGAYRDVGLIRGAELRAGLVNSHNLQPELSFEDIQRELFRKYDLMMTTEVSASGRPMIRIEIESFFYNASADSPTVLNYVKEIKRKVDTSRLYASIKAGSETTDDSAVGGAVSYPETTRWQTFITEQYPSLGQCNIETELDLTSRFIISSNVIEQIVVNNKSDFDDNIVMIEYDANSLQAKQNNWLTSAPPFYYNEGLKNDSVVARFLSGIPSSIANFLGSANDGRFLAHNDQAQNVSGTFSGLPTTAFCGFMPNNDFSGDGFDASNNYGGGTSQGTIIPNVSKWKYTAPQGGFFKFASVYDGILNSLSNGGAVFLKCTFEKFNSSNALIETKIKMFSVAATQSPVPITQAANQSFLMNTGDYVKCMWKLVMNTGGTQNFHFDITGLPSCNFQCTYTSFGGGVWATTDEADFDAYQYIFRHSMNSLQFEKLKSHLSDPIFFNTDGVTNYKGWIDQMTFYRGRNEADFTILSSHRLKP